MSTRIQYFFFTKFGVNLTYQPSYSFSRGQNRLKYCWLDFNNVHAHKMAISFFLSRLRFVA